MPEDNKQPSPLGMLGAGAAGQILGFGLNALGMGMQRKQAQKLQDIQIKGQKEIMDYSKAKDLEMWKATSYPGQMEQMKLAGLNPGLMYGMGGGGGVTTGGTGPGISGQSAQMPHLGNPMDIAQLAMMAAQKANIEADTELKKVDAAKREGVDTQEALSRIDQIKAQTQHEGAKQALTQIETTLKQLDASFQADTYEDRIDSVDYGARTALKNLENLTNTTYINRVTRDAVISEIEARSIGAQLQNIATEAGIQLTKSQITQISNNIAQKWKELGQGDTKNATEQFKAEVQANFPGAMNVLGRLINDGAEQLFNTLKGGRNQHYKTYEKPK